MLPTYDVQVNVRVITSHFLSACRGHALSPVGTEPHRRRKDDHSGETSSPPHCWRCSGKQFSCVTFRELLKLMPLLAEPQWGTEEGARKVWICSSWSLCCWCSHQLRRRPGREFFGQQNLHPTFLKSLTVVLTSICCQGREKDAKITIYKKTEDT